MNRALIPLLALLLIGCNHDHDHGHEGGHDHDHKHGEDAAHEHTPAPTPAPAATTGPAAPGAFAVGTWSATLVPTPDTLSLTLLSGGTPVAPEGDAKVVLTGVGEDEQRLTLPASGDGWSGPAKAAGAAGYTAVVSVTIGGVTQSGKIQWGAVPDPPPAASDDHGEPGHSHEPGGHSH